MRKVVIRKALPAWAHSFGSWLARTIVLALTGKTSQDLPAEPEPIRDGRIIRRSLVPEQLVQEVQKFARIIADELPNGLRGEPGAPGRNGIDGKSGLDGRNGRDGRPGQDGRDGATIHFGDGPPSPALGSPGDGYIDRVNWRFYGPKTEYGWGQGHDLRVPVVVQNGLISRSRFSGMLLNSVGAPSATLGILGDFCLDTVATRLYGPKTAAGWGSGTLIGGGGSGGDVTRWRVMLGA